MGSFKAVLSAPHFGQLVLWELLPEERWVACRSDMHKEESRSWEGCLHIGTQRHSHIAGVRLRACVCACVHGVSTRIPVLHPSGQVGVSARVSIEGLAFLPTTWVHQGRGL